jgi:hypothetical protein
MTPRIPQDPVISNLCFIVDCSSSLKLGQILTKFVYNILINDILTLQCAIACLSFHDFQ